MASHPASRNVSTRRRAWLTALALLVLGFLPILGAAHSHAGEPEHRTCHLCEMAFQTYDPPVPARVSVPVDILLFLLRDASPGAARPLPVPHDSRGPPFA